MSNQPVQTLSLTVENEGAGKTLSSSAVFHSFSPGGITKVVLVDGYLPTKFEPPSFYRPRNLTP